ncbi:MAG: cell wall anchor protein [Opitutaceae bacterium]|jgi:hypothetical protein|nr:cell wall anchor protein [Opitutaceae bacterium]
MKHKHTILPARVFGLLPALVFAGSLHAAAPVTIVTDQVESTTDWSRSDTSVYTNNRFVSASTTAPTPAEVGLAPTAGSAFWLAGGAAKSRGIARLFAGEVFAVGTYTVTFDMGRVVTTLFTDFPTFTIALVADTNNDSAYAWNERVTTDVFTNPTPVAGTWEKWTYTFEITEDTKNANSLSVIGTTLGFVVASTVTATSGYAFDNLVITYTAAPVPEPGMVAALAGLTALGAAICVRRFRKVRVY